MKSSIAAPSLRNSGLETTSNSTVRAALGERRSISRAHLVRRADRHRRFGDDDAVAAHVRADGARDREHVAQVRRAVLLGRGADRDQLEQPVRHALDRVGREFDAARPRRCA